VGDVTPTARPGTTEQTLLGEGARWDARRDELLRVDIVAGRVYRDRVTADGSLELVRSYDVPGTVGAIVPIDGDDGWLLAAGRGFAHLLPDGAIRVLAEVVADDSRMNDGACDPQGRFWAGTMAYDESPGAGTLYRLELDGSCSTVLTGLTISNGIGWSPDGETMYLSDSGRAMVEAFDFDGATGALSGRRQLVHVDRPGVAPDGLTVDEQGDLWVGLYGGWAVNRYAPDGSLRATVHMPVAQATSCAFGGRDRRTLFVTTGRERLEEDALEVQPDAGRVFAVTGLGVRGPACVPYRGRMFK
jgi:sugar lactone lactonase YvrE